MGAAKQHHMLQRMSGKNPSERGDDLRSIVVDPHWFLEDYDPSIRKLRFVHADRNTIAATPFLAEGMWDYSRYPQKEVTESELLGLVPFDAPPPRINFIWHTAFCCSTLIASTLDREGANVSLKEPGIMLILADAKRQNAIGQGRPFSHRFPELVFRLLGRPFRPGAQVTIKPTNFSNYVLRDAASLTQGKHLFLFSDCRSFVASILKKGEYGRRVAREIYSRIVRDGNEQAGWPFGEVFHLTDMQIAAVVWHMQIAEFRRSWPLMAPGRAASLDCDAFLAKPADTLLAIDEFLGLDLGRAHYESAMESLANRHSKAASMEYSIADRLADHAGIFERFGTEIDAAVRQSYDLCRSTPRGIPLDNPLVPVEKSYLP